MEAKQEVAVVGEVKAAEKSSWNGVQIFTKAMELPMVPTITGTISAATEMVSGTSIATKMVETIKGVGEYEGVKTVLSKAQTTYDSSLAPRVGVLVEKVVPTIKTLDDMACNSVDKINLKVEETKEVYVTPVVNKVNSVHAKASSAIEYGKSLVSSTKEVIATEGPTGLIKRTARQVFDTTSSLAYQTGERVVVTTKGYVDEHRETAVTYVDGVRKATVERIQTTFPTASKVVFSVVGTTVSASVVVYETTMSVAKWALSTTQ